LLLPGIGDKRSGSFTKIRKKHKKIRKKSEREKEKAEIIKDEAFDNVAGGIQNTGNINADTVYGDAINSIKDESVNIGNEQNKTDSHNVTVDQKVNSKVSLW